jgi:DNA-binding MarR family transcriptional regulator
MPNVVADFYQALERQRALLNPNQLQLELLGLIRKQPLHVYELVRSSGVGVIELGENLKSLKTAGLIEDIQDVKSGEMIELTEKGRGLLEELHRQ